METKHTPGPWCLDDDGFVYGEGFIVSDPHSSPDIDPDEREANARLIAAAPELLAALQWFCACMHDDSVDDMGKFINEMESRARAAIAKATGQ